MLKEIFKKIIIKRNSKSYVKYLRKIGMIVGENVNIWSCRRVTIDETRPWLIKIGNNVNITEDVKILTHGYDWSVLKALDARVYGSAGRVTIGNNVFVGVNSVILKGVEIGDNVIIGAGSIVNKNCESNSVYAGNPARKICTIEEYREKLLKRQEKEGIECAREYFNKFSIEPNKNIMNEFMWLFESTTQELTEGEINQLKNTGNYEESIKILTNNKPIFKNYEEFIKKACKKDY